MTRAVVSREKVEGRRKKERGGKDEKEWWIVSERKEGYKKTRREGEKNSTHSIQEP